MYKAAGIPLKYCLTVYAVAPCIFKQYFKGLHPTSCISRLYLKGLHMAPKLFEVYTVAPCIFNPSTTNSHHSGF